MDPEFRRMLLGVMAIGGAIGVIGAAALIVAFRSFGRLRGPLLVGAVIAFVLVVCVALLLASMLGR